MSSKSLLFESKDPIFGEVDRSSPFEVRDGPAFDEAKPCKKPYSGPESRRGQRRKNQDRREEVRFDLKNEDRRQNPGRREGDKSPNFW